MALATRVSRGVDRFQLGGSFGAHTLSSRSVPRGRKGESMSLQAHFDLREESHKSWKHHICNEIVYLPESFPVFADGEGVGIQSVSLPEIYLKGNAWIDLQFSLVGERNAHYVAIIESLHTNVERIRRAKSTLSTGFKTKDFSARDVRKDNFDFAAISGDSPMLVEVAESIQSPQRVCSVGCPSVVWLKRFDFVDSLRGNSRNLSVENLSMSLLAEGK